MTRRAMIQKWILYGLCALALVLAEIFCANLGGSATMCGWSSGACIPSCCRPSP